VTVSKKLLGIIYRPWQTVLLAKEVYPHIQGHVMAQTSPAFAYDKDATIAHAQRLVRVFEAHGIPRNRVCIKIPATPESLLACQVLENAGIRTLGTCLFSLPQALAGAQAGCTYVAPYFNGGSPSTTSYSLAHSFIGHRASCAFRAHLVVQL
jgi:transaldolase